MAGDAVALMRQLGHERFAVVGHDRGSYVAMRTALDHPAAVAALGVLDSVPIGEALARADARFAAAVVALVLPRPDREAGGAGDQRRPGRLVRRRSRGRWARRRTRTSGAAIHDPAVVHAMCEDYRAGLGPGPGRRRRRPRRRPADRLPDAGALVAPGRPGRPVRRRARRLAGLGGRPARRRDRLRPPHGRGGAGAARRAAARLPGRGWAGSGRGLDRGCSALSREAAIGHHPRRCHRLPRRGVPHCPGRLDGPRAAGGAGAARPPDGRRHRPRRPRPGGLPRPGSSRTTSSCSTTSGCSPGWPGRRRTGTSATWSTSPTPPGTRSSRCTGSWPASSAPTWPAPPPRPRPLAYTGFLLDAAADYGRGPGRAAALHVGLLDARPAAGRAAAGGAAVRPLGGDLRRPRFAALAARVRADARRGAGRGAGRRGDRDRGLRHRTCGTSSRSGTCSGRRPTPRRPPPPPAPSAPDGAGPPGGHGVGHLTGPDRRGPDHGGRPGHAPVGSAGPAGPAGREVTAPAGRRFTRTRARPPSRTRQATEVDQPAAQFATLCVISRCPQATSRSALVSHGVPAIRNRCRPDRATSEPPMPCDPDRAEGCAHRAHWTPCPSCPRSRRSPRSCASGRWATSWPGSTRPRSAR